MNDERWKIVSAGLASLTLFFYLLLHAVLDQRDDARAVTRAQAIEVLCKGLINDQRPQSLAEPAAGQQRQQPAERFQL